MNAKSSRAALLTAVGVATVAMTIGSAQAPQGQAPAAPAAQGQGAGGRAGGGGGRGAQAQAPSSLDLKQMLAAVPEKAPATPAQPRRVLVLARAAGFVHSSIPLASRTIEALGMNTGAW